jgi:hypothetical protein
VVLSTRLENDAAAKILLSGALSDLFPFIDKVAPSKSDNSNRNYF